MLIDDNKDLLLIAKKFLAKYEPKIKLMTTASPYKALSMLASENFDVVVSDYHMLAINGLGLLKRLQQQGIDIPFIIFTSHSSEGVAMQALKLGASYYLKKGRDIKSMFGEFAHIIRTVVQH